MTQINLPTYEQQDEILTKLNDVESRLLGEGFSAEISSTHGSNNVLDITGAGVLVSLYCSSSANIFVQLDSGPIYKVGASANGLSYTLFLKFNTSLKITTQISNTQNIAVRYNLI